MKGYYKLQIRHGDTGQNYVDEVIADNRITSHIDYAGVGFEKLNIGDILLIHKGNSPYCLVEVLYKINNSSDIKGTDFGINYKIKVLSYFKDLDNSLSFKINNSKIGFNGTFIPLYNDTKTLLFIQEWYNYINKKEMNQNIINLLQYKKQIILQGPPGTGKTKFAKEIADKILNENPQNFSPLELIDNFFKEGKSNTEYNIAFKKRLEEFYKSFPKNELSKMNLDDYSIGKGDNSNFCWWIEVGLSKYGKFSPGNSRNYIIYFSKDEDDYVLSKVKDESISDAFPKITQSLQQLANDESYDDAKKIFGDSFIIKILNSYYPEKYFPINGKTALVNLMKLFGRESKNIKTIDLNLQIQNIFLDYKNKYPSEITNLDFMKFLYSKFNLNNDGNVYNNSVDNIIKRKPTIIQFHPSYTYEDFIRGIVAEAAEKGVIYKTQNKVLAEISKQAFENPYSNYVLIIDEVNRANLSSVVGELIYALEYRFFYDDSEDKQNLSKVESPYAMKNPDTKEESRELFLPENLYIIGTMNTADRSVGHIDYAIRRRFAFVDVLPEKLEDNNDVFFNTDAFSEVSELFIKVGENDVINFENAENSIFLSNDFYAKDVALGHSYFIAEKKKISLEEKDNYFKIKMKYEVIPILKEYLKDGVFNESATAKIKEIEQRFA